MGQHHTNHDGHKNYMQRSCSIKIGWWHSPEFNWMHFPSIIRSLLINSPKMTIALTFHCNLPFKNVTLSHVWCVHTWQVFQTFGWWDFQTWKVTYDRDFPSRKTLVVHQKVKLLKLFEAKYYFLVRLIGSEWRYVFFYKYVF